MISKYTPIYLQIAEQICCHIAMDLFKADERIPSVRELSIEISVNPNTTFRAFELLERENIIYQQRGLGYFVSKNAKENIIQRNRKKIFDNILPELFKDMKMFDISIEEVVDAFKNWKE